MINILDSYLRYILLTLTYKLSSFLIPNLVMSIIIKRITQNTTVPTTLAFQVNFMGFSEKNENKFSVIITNIKNICIFHILYIYKIKVEIHQNKNKTVLFVHASEQHSLIQLISAKSS